MLWAGLAVYAAGIAGVAAVASTHATSLTFAPVLLVAGLGMGAIFAPLATEAMRAAPPRLAGATSGVLNTGRQLGGTLGGAITGAVLASQLASAIHLRAVADARFLPAPARAPFVSGFSRAARSGLQVGRGQAVATPPRGTPAALLPEITRLIRDVFSHGYIAAMQPTLAISVGLLLAGTLACLLLRRHPAPITDPVPARSPVPAQALSASNSESTETR